MILRLFNKLRHLLLRRSVARLCYLFLPALIVLLYLRLQQNGLSSLTVSNESVLKNNAIQHYNLHKVKSKIHDQTVRYVVPQNPPLQNKMINVLLQPNLTNGGNHKYPLYFLKGQRQNRLKLPIDENNPYPDQQNDPYFQESEEEIDSVQDLNESRPETHVRINPHFNDSFKDSSSGYESSQEEVVGVATRDEQVKDGSEEDEKEEEESVQKGSSKEDKEERGSPKEEVQEEEESGQNESSSKEEHQVEEKEEGVSEEEDQVEEGASKEDHAEGHPKEEDQAAKVSPQEEKEGDLLEKGPKEEDSQTEVPPKDHQESDPPNEDRDGGHPREEEHPREDHLQEGNNLEEKGDLQGHNSEERDHQENPQQAKVQDPEYHLKEGDHLQNGLLQEGDEKDLEEGKQQDGVHLQEEQNVEDEEEEEKKLPPKENEFGHQDGEQDIGVAQPKLNPSNAIKNISQQAEKLKSVEENNDLKKIIILSRNKNQKMRGLYEQVDTKRGMAKTLRESSILDIAYEAKHVARAKPIENVLNKVDEEEEILNNHNGSETTPCGEVCSYTINNWTAGKYYLKVMKQIVCIDIMKRMAENIKDVGPPPKYLASQMVNKFSQNGDCPFGNFSYFVNDPKARVKQHGYGFSLIELYKEGVRHGKMIPHEEGIVMLNLITKYQIALKDKQGFVYGTHTPWLQAALLNVNAARIITLEDIDLQINHPQINVQDPGVFAKDWLQGHEKRLDFGASFGVVDKLGFGHFQGPLNPFGDLEGMAQIHCMLKPGGLFFLAVPYKNHCEIQYNTLRMYSSKRLQHLTANFNVLEQVIQGSYVVLVLMKA